MAELLFRLNGVPEDEALEVRALLEEAGIEFYETHAGNWGVSVAAIWRADNTGQLEEATALIEEYQRQRLQSVRQEALENPPESLMQRCLRHPFQALAVVVAIGFILFLLIAPFLTAWDDVQ
ncbi:DUF6164 family protein [Pseudomaricurvus sp.]|uniref:DUF6164 family protein n=1 Tax=Pseudomaricurvus sp. TaxID=2004510 RepID=UPI003F6D756E